VERFGKSLGSMAYHSPASAHTLSHQILIIMSFLSTTYILSGIVLGINKCTF
jgi:hypothetical protein